MPELYICNIPELLCILAGQGRKDDPILNTITGKITITDGCIIPISEQGKSRKGPAVVGSPLVFDFGFK